MEVARGFCGYPSDDFHSITSNLISVISNRKPFPESSLAVGAALDLLNRFLLVERSFGILHDNFSIYNIGIVAFNITNNLTNDDADTWKEDIRKGTFSNEQEFIKIRKHLLNLNPLRHIELSAEKYLLELNLEADKTVKALKSLALLRTIGDVYNISSRVLITSLVVYLFEDEKEKIVNNVIFRIHQAFLSIHSLPLWLERIRDRFNYDEENDYATVVENQIEDYMTLKSKLQTGELQKNSLKFIAKGAYGSVSSAKFGNDNYAIKRQTMLKDTMIREISILNALQHSNIINIYGFDESLKEIHYVMELGNGTLEKLIKSKEEFDVSGLYFQLISAAKYLEKHSIIHRDIKPSNIIVFDNGVIKLSDFGTSIYTSTDLIPRQVKGTLAYLPPQQIEDFILDELSVYGFRLDVFSIGIILLETLFKVHPWLPFVDLNLEIRKIIDSIKNTLAKLPQKYEYLKSLLVFKEENRSYASKLI